MVVCDSREERIKMISGITDVLVKTHPDAIPVHFSQDKEHFSSVIEHLSTKPFFNTHIIVQVDEAGQYIKKQREILEGFIIKPSEFAFLILGLSSLKDYSTVCNLAKNQLVVLDLSQEKPWDRQRRLQGWLIEKALEEGKKMSASVAEEMLTACGLDILLLEQELSKVICYVGDRSQLVSEDLVQLGIQHKLPTGWQMAESLLWEGRAVIKDPSFSLSDFLPLLGQVRYHLHLARQLSALLLEGADRERIATQLPQLRQNMFDKYRKLVSDYPIDFFNQAMKCLFKIELLSKNSTLSAPFLWDYLAAQIAQQKIDYANTRSARSYP